MPALQPQPQLITLEQYEALPEDRRVEVFDGIIYDMGSPSQIRVLDGKRQNVWSTISQKNARKNIVSVLMKIMI